MEAEMERPVKRRRVDYTSQDDQHVGSSEHTAAHAHEITHLAAESPKRHSGHIQEVHMRIRTRTRPSKDEQDLERRQLGVGVGVSLSAALPNPTLAGVAAPSLTVGATAGISAGVSAGVSNGVSVGVSASVNIPSLSVPSLTGGLEGSSQTTPAPSSGLKPSDLNSSSLANTLLSTGALSSGIRNSTISASLYSNSTDVYLATLDGTTYTIGRESHAYTTTFPNGQVAVITGASHSSHTASATTTSDSAASTSDGQNSGDSPTAPVGGAGLATTSSSSASSATSSVAASNNNTDTPPPGVIAGGVVGGAAGLAVLILIATIFLRWYRRRSQLGHHALPPNATPEIGGPSQSRSGPGMAERAGLTPLMGAVPTFFRHKNRNKAIGDGAAAETGERGFTRVSGRKLPSQFSEGMTSYPPPPPPPPPGNPEMGQNYNNNMSFYRDSNGFYGGEGAAAGDMYRQPSDASSTHVVDMNPSPEFMTLSPGPQRRPTVSQGGPYFMQSNMQQQPQPRYPSPHGHETGGFERITGAQQLPSHYDGYGPVSTDSPYNESRATFDRTVTPSPADHFESGVRNSRFTEQV